MKAYDQSRCSEFQKRLDMEQFHHFGTVLVKEDRETGKLVQIAEAAAFVYATKSQRAT